MKYKNYLQSYPLLLFIVHEKECAVQYGVRPDFLFE